MPSAVPTLVRTEGLTERVGDIVLACSGATPGITVIGNLTIFLNVNVTNRLASDNSVDAHLTIDANPSNVAAQLFAPNAIAFNGLSFTVPASGAVTLKLTNLRAAATQAANAAPIFAFAAFNGSTNFTITNSQFTVALPQTGLLATFSSSGIRCVGSPLPQTITLANLFATGTRFFSTRVTEGYPQAFQTRDLSSDTGVRILVRYAGYPTGARLFVPDAIAGSSTLHPTAGGDLGLPPSGGQYSPGGRGSLVLSRVIGSDANGAGGTLAFTPGPAGSGTVTFNSASEVTLQNGAGFAVYEVVDSDPAIRESAQFPTFLGLAPILDGSTVIARQDVSLAPVSTVNTSTASDPIPRFVRLPPPSDCPALQDCNASYFPSLLIDAPPLQFAGPFALLYNPKYIRVINQGGGLLNWTASATYKSGANWLSLDPAFGLNGGTIRLDSHPERLTPGTYEAMLTIDAGPLAGTRTLPVTITVSALPPPPPNPAPIVTSVMNAATLQAGPLAPGSLATVKGAKLSGASVSITFDGIPATVLYSSDDQINLQVPAALAGKATAQMMITVNGTAGAPTAVSLASAAPGIFANGVLNQDNSVNGAASPAAPGSAIQIFATGLIPPAGGAVSVRFGDLETTSLLFAGGAPGITGVQQVNVLVPTDLTTNADLRVCALSSQPGSQAGSQPVCSPPVTLSIR